MPIIDYNFGVGMGSGASNFWSQPGMAGRTFGSNKPPQRRVTAADAGVRDIPQMTGGIKPPRTGMSIAEPHEGPASGGPEEPGTPDTSPSTLSEGGLVRAVQKLQPPNPGWSEIPAPETMNPGLGSRMGGEGTPMKVLKQLVRGVY